jgi:hypothetical protein
VACTAAAGGACSAVGQVVSIAFPNTAPDAVVTATLQVALAPGVSFGAVLEGLARVGGATFDPASANDQVRVAITVGEVQYRMLYLPVIRR